jgi:hypothetical protein
LLFFAESPGPIEAQVTEVKKGGPGDAVVAKANIITRESKGRYRNRDLGIFSPFRSKVLTFH